MIKGRQVDTASLPTHALTPIHLSPFGLGSLHNRPCIPLCGHQRPPSREMMPEIKPDSIE